MNLKLKVMSLTLVYAVALLEAHLIEQGVVADDHQKHTGRVVMPVTVSTSSSASATFSMISNTISGPDYQLPPRDWRTSMRSS